MPPTPSRIASLGRRRDRASAICASTRSGCPSTWKGVVVPLTVTEFLLLQALVRRPGAVLTRDQLMDGRLSRTARPSAIAPSTATSSASAGNSSLPTRPSRGSKACLRRRLPLRRRHGMNLAADGFRRLVGIGLRLLAFNLLVVFVPVTACCISTSTRRSCDRRRRRVSCSRRASWRPSLGTVPSLDAGQPSRLFARLERRSDARLRVYDAGGALIADSARRGCGNRARRSREVPRHRRSQRPAALALSDGRVAGAATASRSVVPAVKQRARRSVRRSRHRGRTGGGSRRAGGPLRRGDTRHARPAIRHVVQRRSRPAREPVTGAVVASQSTFRILLGAVRQCACGCSKSSSPR